MKNLILWVLVVLSQVCLAQPTSSVQFTLVPDWGTNSLLQGMVHGTTISDHRVAVYIFLEEAGGWWNKPYASNPVTLIQPDSTFTTNIATGSNNQFATRIIAFLIPSAFSPPVLSGGELPGELFFYPHVSSCRPHGDRIIKWSGLDWVVKKSIGSTPVSVGPGPNIFNDNDSMVWVDGQQKLHLRIARQGDTWYSSEIICKASLGYRQYKFDVATRVDLLDPNIIAGIFTWDDCSPFADPPNNYFREIDFEFSRWGSFNNDNSQFVIQPYNVPGNINRFNMNLSGLSHSVHSFDWSSDSIVFNSTWGSSSFTWKYTNPVYFPTPGSENIRINFWLLNGNGPTGGMNAELILNNFATNTGEVSVGSSQVKIYPNPMEQTCVIEILSGNVEELKADISDLYGKHVKNLFSGKLNIGSNRFIWDGRNDHGMNLPPGIYLLYYRNSLESQHVKIIKK